MGIALKAATHQLSPADDAPVLSTSATDWCHPQVHARLQQLPARMQRLEAQRAQRAPAWPSGCLWAGLMPSPATARAQAQSTFK